jgi:hypothetical protein
VLVSGGFGDNGIPLAAAELYTSLALRVAPMTALVNQAVTVTGVNFSPQEVVCLYWNNPGTHLLATVTTDGDGSFVVRLRLPRDRRGRHLIYAVGRRSQAPVSVTVAVR